MDDHSEWTHQELLKHRLSSRDNGFNVFIAAEQDTIVRRFDQQAALHPQKPAVVTRTRVLTYRELGRVSCAISRALDEQLQGNPQPIVVLVANPATFIASALGALRAGGFYIPVDPQFLRTATLVSCRTRAPDSS